MPAALVWGRVPSESTVEVLANHYILHHLNKGAAWIFCPTRNEEMTLGYDASLQNSKIVVIQYKRVKPRKRRKGFSIPIDVKQHVELLKNLPKVDPKGNIYPRYVFYSFAAYRTYNELNNDYLGTDTPVFFDKTVFFDAHDVLPGTKSVDFESGHLGVPFEGTDSAMPIWCYRGPELVFGIWACMLGRRIVEGGQREGSHKRPHVSVLIWKKPADQSRN